MIQFTYLPRWPWVAGGAVLVLASLWWSYRRAKGKPTFSLRLFLVAVRFAAIAAVVLCLMDPQWVKTITHQPKSRLAVLLDSSRSMGIRDVPAGRMAAAKEWVQKNVTPAVPKGVSISSFSFDQTLMPLQKLDSASPTGSVTALSGALESLLAAAGEDPLSGVILLSDGIENVGQPLDRVARLYRRKGIPIHTVVVGTTNEIRDLILENVQVKRAVPNEAPTRVGLLLRSPGYKDKTVAIQIRSQKEVIAVHEVKLSGTSQKVEIEITPRQKGFQIYEANIAPQPGEWLTTNNRRLFGVEVMDPTIRVIYMEGTPQQSTSPKAEWKYLKDALESDPNVKVKTLFRQFGANGQYLNTIDSDLDTGEKIYPVEHPTHGFPKTLEGLLDYDVVIHSDIKKESFKPEQLKNIARFVQEYGGGFVMIGGNSAFGKGGYHRTILDRIIPVAMGEENDSQARVVRMRAPPSVLNHPIMNIGATREETEEIWGRKFPVLHGCNRVERAKPGAVVLGEDLSYQTPFGRGLLLAVQEIGQGRSMAFTSDTTRSWGRDFETIWGEPINPKLALSEENCDSRYYRQFWVNAIRWLASGRVSRTNNPVTLELAKSYCFPGESVAARVQVRTADLKEVSNAEVSLLLSVGMKTNTAVAARYEASTRSYVADLQSVVAGDFRVTAVARSKGARLGEDHQLLIAEATDAEMAELRARPDAMAALARDSGGKACASGDQGPALAGSMFANVPPPRIEHRRKPVWDKWVWLALILGLLSVEWGMRRVRGMA